VDDALDACPALLALVQLMEAAAALPSDTLVRSQLQPHGSQLARMISCLTQQNMGGISIAQAPHPL